ncbi:MAG: hypothetical protein MRQ09_04045 [Candidatus Midichloria sp.]|nr:hypothetical protein [Candidatus Midichloria sp.]
MIKHEKNYSVEEVVPTTENSFYETVKNVGLPIPLVSTLSSFAAFIYSKKTLKISYPKLHLFWKGGRL